MKMTIEEIAAVCHGANRAICLAYGDHSQVPWAEAPDWQKESAIAGVNEAIANRDATPRSMHAAWRDRKVAEGWTWGPQKDAEQKTHPALLEFDNLPLAQQIKDSVFLSIVRALEDP